MRATSLRGLWCVLALSASGCPGLTDKPVAPAHNRRLQDRADRLGELEIQLAALRSENDVFQARIRELRTRERALSDRLRRSEFVAEQLDKQIEALSGVPAERDRQAARADALALEVDRLTKELDRLKRLVPPPARRPARAPAVERP